MPAMAAWMDAEHGGRMRAGKPVAHCSVDGDEDNATPTRVPSSHRALASDLNDLSAHTMYAPLHACPIATLTVSEFFFFLNSCSSRRTHRQCTPHRHAFVSIPRGYYPLSSRSPLNLVGPKLIIQLQSISK